MARTPTAAPRNICAAAAAVPRLAPWNIHVPATNRHRYYLLRAAAWALTVGANAAFGAQALNHELSHAKTRWLAAPCALVASAMTTFPWFSYYFAGGHERHHLHVGTPRDADADALFWLWERQPVHRADVWGAGPKEPRPLTTLQRLGDSAAGGVAWASTVAAALPVAYAYVRPGINRSGQRRRRDCDADTLWTNRGGRRGRDADSPRRRIAADAAAATRIVRGDESAATRRGHAAEASIATRLFGRERRVRAGTRSSRASRTTGTQTRKRRASGCWSRRRRFWCFER